jgi:hypothetical protein
VQPGKNGFGATGPGSDFVVESNERFPNMAFDHHLVRQPSEGPRCEEVPAEARNPAFPAGEPWLGAGVVRHATTQTVTNEDFDGTTLVERHGDARNRSRARRAASLCHRFVSETTRTPYGR